MIDIWRLLSSGENQILIVLLDYNLSFFLIFPQVNMGFCNVKMKKKKKLSSSSQYFIKMIGIFNKYFLKYYIVVNVIYSLQSVFMF